MHSTIGAISSGVPVIPVAYSRKFNGLYDTLEYPYYIDAKSNLNVDGALEKFYSYMSQISELQEGVASAKSVYSANLKKYQEYLAQILNLI